MKKYKLRMILECESCGADTYVGVIPVGFHAGRNFVQQPVKCVKCGGGFVVHINELQVDVLNKRSVDAASGAK